MDVFSRAVRLVSGAARFAGGGRKLLDGKDAGCQSLGRDAGGDQLRLWGQRFVSGLQRCLFGKRSVAAVGADVRLENESQRWGNQGNIRGRRLLLDDDTRWRSANGLSRGVDCGGDVCSGGFQPPRKLCWG